MEVIATLLGIVLLVGLFIALVNDMVVEANKIDDE
jgi:hypothetical protein